MKNLAEENYSVNQGVGETSKKEKYEGGVMRK